MGNLSKLKRDRMLKFLEQIKTYHTDDESIIALAEIEKELVSKKYGLVWEQHEEAVELMMQESIPAFVEDKSREIISDENKKYNFLLEGDNLHSLILLGKTLRNSIDVIYIDPPYNTGAKDWKYNNDFVDKNDGYRHSKWLSMMHARMKEAQTLLKDDGVFICAIDENELGTLLLLIEEVFGPGYSIDPIAIVHNPRGVQGENFSYVNEYAVFVYKRGYKVIGERMVEEDDVEWSPLRNWGSESERSDARNCFYPIFVKDNKIIGFGEVTPNDIHPKQTEYIEEKDMYAVYPIDIKGVERKWRYARQTVESIWHLLRAKETKTGFDIEIGKNYAPYKTVWTDKKYDANEYGTQLIGSMIPNNEFTFPKSLYTVYDCLYAVLRDRKDAIVLDYFAGSGTTGHAVMLLNKNMKSGHRFILCTNNDVGEKREKEFSSKYGNIEEYSDEWKAWIKQYGIASSVTYPRMASAIKGFVHTKDFKNILYQKKITPTVFANSSKVLDEINLIKVKNKDKYDEIKVEIDGDTIVAIGINQKGKIVDGFRENIKYYETSFVKKDSEEICEDLIRHVAEMIQIEYGASIDNQKYIIIMDDEEMDAFEKDIEKYGNIESVFINQEVLLSSSQERMLEDINTFIVPDCYFDSELREVGELW